MEILHPIVYLSYEVLSTYCSRVKAVIQDEILSDECSPAFVSDTIARFENERNLIKDEIDTNTHVGFELKALQKNYNLMDEVLKYLHTIEEEGYDDNTKAPSDPSYFSSPKYRR